MDQEKFGKLIKDIRKKNNLTQKQLANKYNVTYQAVSKWENGLNMPDIALMLEISKDFGISLDGLLNCKEEKKALKKKKIFIISGVILSILILLIALSFILKSFIRDNDFQFKTLSTECKNFTISGNISYNAKKAAIYVTNIRYCGGNDTQEYKKIECTLYEQAGDMVRKINNYMSQKEMIKLEDFLENVTLSVDNYVKTCEYYKTDSLYLIINATDENDKITTYKIPLKMDNCS